MDTDFITNYGEENKDKKQAYLRIYGVTQETNTVFIRVRNFLSYFYVKVPNNFDETDDKAINNFKKEMHVS